MLARPACLPLGRRSAPHRRRSGSAVARDRARVPPFLQHADVTLGVAAPDAAFKSRRLLGVFDSETGYKMRMPDQNLKTLIAQGFAAAKAGGEVAKRATTEIQQDASDAHLKEALQQGSRTAEQWQQRLERGLRETGGSEQHDNPILEAHYEVAQRIRRAAPDDRSRDLGIIAAGQLALHYWIATFGTLRTYASALQMNDVARELQTCLDEAKRGDQQLTDLAEELLRGVPA